MQSPEFQLFGMVFGGQALSWPCLTASHVDESHMCALSPIHFWAIVNERTSVRSRVDSIVEAVALIVVHVRPLPSAVLLQGSAKR